MAKALHTEKEEWLKNSLPDNDGQDEFYQTSAPVIIFQMVDQHLQVTNTIHSEFTFSALVLSIQQITKYGYKYRESIIDFKEKHFKDRSLVMSHSLEYYSYKIPTDVIVLNFLRFCLLLDAIFHATFDNNCQ